MATNMWCKSTPGIPDSSSSGMPARQLQGADDLFDGRELDARLAPGSGAGGDTGVIEPPRGVLHEPRAPAALEEAADRGVVTHVAGDAEHDDLVGVEVLEQPLRVGVREYVEVLLQEQKLAPAQVAVGQRFQRDRHRILLLGLRHLARATRAAEAVR